MRCASLILCWILITTTGCLRMSSEQRNLKSLQQLVQAERQFAAASRELGTREAFLGAFAADGLIFYDRPVNAIEYWSAQPAEQDWLNWKPVYAAIAASGEIGWTSGPYTYKPERTDAAASSHGFFFSVWKKEAGSWKVWLDLGIGTPLDPADTLRRFRPPFKERADSMQAATVDSAEAAFIADHTSIGTRAWRYRLRDSCLVLRPGKSPALDKQAGLELIRAQDETVVYTVIDSRTAASGELAVVYGSVEITQTAGDSSRVRSGYYIRVWTWEEGDWTIEADLLRAPNR